MAESKTKRITVKRCSSKEEANIELVKGLLGNGPMMLQLLVMTLSYVPYELSSKEIIEVLNKLNEEGLLKIDKFKGYWFVGEPIFKLDVMLALVK